MVCDSQIQAHLTCTHSAILHFLALPLLCLFPFLSITAQLVFLFEWIFFRVQCLWWGVVLGNESAVQCSWLLYPVLLLLRTAFSSRRLYTARANDGEGQCMRTTSWGLSSPTPFCRNDCIQGTFCRYTHMIWYAFWRQLIMEGKCAISYWYSTYVLRGKGLLQSLENMEKPRMNTDEIMQRVVCKQVQLSQNKLQFLSSSITCVQNFIKVAQL